MTAYQPVTRPTPSPLVNKTKQDFLRAVEELAPLLREEAEEGDRRACLTDRAAYAMQAAGLFHIVLPKDYGGAELPFVDAVEIMEAVSRIDASAGWYVIVQVASSATSVFYSEQGGKEIFDKAPFAIIAGQGFPKGKAYPAEGGYTIRGPWSYGSTIYHSDFTHTACMVFNEDGSPKLNEYGLQEAIITIFPTSEVEFQDNWDTIGLRGTGSFDYDIRDGKELFVPQHMTYDFWSEPPHRGGLQYGIGLPGILSLAHGGWALGVARHALDEAGKLAFKKGMLGMLGDSATFRHRYIESESKLRSARAFLYEIWNDVMATFDRGEQASFEQVTLLRMATRHVHDVGAEVATFAYNAGGGTSLRQCELQRVFRDMMAGVQHVVVANETYEECARVLLGMAGENPRWAGFRIVND